MSEKQGFSELDIHFARFLARVTGDDSPELFSAAALASNARGRGNTCLDLSSELKMQAPDSGAELNTRFDPDNLRAVLEKSPAVGGPGDYKPLILDGSRLYLYRYWEYEDILAKELKSLSSRLLKTDGELLRQRIARLFPRGSLGQKQAAVIASLKQFTVIAGGPGTGKTSAVARTIALLNEQAGAGSQGKALRTALAAPTGKAAARLQESLRSEIEGIDCDAATRSAIPLEASTLHRLLGWGPRGFRYNRSNRLDLDLVVVDEASMVDLALLSRLVQALPAHCRLILLGDKDQLASVEAGSVLGDICGAERKSYSREMQGCLAEVLGKDVYENEQRTAAATGIADCIANLDESFRFGPDSVIGSLSSAINAGDSEKAQAACEAGSQAQWHNLPDFRRLAAELKGPVLECFGPVLKSPSPEDALRNLNSFRILSALREGPFGVRALNETVKEILRAAGLISPALYWSGGDRFYKGCPIMVTSNNYSLDLYNGDVGIIWPDPQNRRQLRAFFSAPGGTRSFPLLSLPEHEPVYAMTVHKSQGSEFNRVLIVLPDRDTPLLTRELVYTAVTRAREHVEIWAKREIFSAALSRRIERSSGLREALWGV